MIRNSVYEKEREIREDREIEKEGKKSGEKTWSIT